MSYFQSFEELYEKKERIPTQSEAFFRLIPQEGVHHTFVEDSPEHNAIWDMAIRKSDGRVFLSVCGEGLSPIYARLYEYLPGQARFVRHFDLEKEAIQQDRAIRASKFHTSISFMDDGCLIMQSHTTSLSPRHPAWMPESYLNHQWESFQGSEIFIYNPDTKKVESKGILSPFNTLYGGAYSNRGNLFFGCGLFDGRGYIYDLDTNTSTCIGQVTDGKSQRIYEGPDGHLYYGTYTGHLARLNIDSRKIEILAQLREKSQMRHGAFDENGVFWFSTREGKVLYTFDTKTDECKEIGLFLEEEALLPGNIHSYGFDFDSNGCIWFCANINLDPGGTGGSDFGIYSGTRLYKWDVRNEKKPIDFGFIGTPETRCIALCAQVSIHNDVLFVTDGNHLDDSVALFEIDLSQMTEDKVNDTRPFALDPNVYLPIENGRKLFPLGEDKYDLLVKEDIKHYHKYYEAYLVRKANNSYAVFNGMTGVALWETLGYGNGAVKALRWEDNETLAGVSGDDELYSFRLKLDSDGLRMLAYKKDYDAVIASRLTVPVPESLTLPCMPGRQYLAAAECSVELADGSLVIGTKDMMLCRIRDGKVFGLGAVTTSGGVHCLSVAPDGMTVYGVAGYEMGKGDLFRFNEKDGLLWLGTVPYTPTVTGRQLVITRPWVCAVSPNGKYLAIGSLDEMGGVGVYTL